MSGYTANGATLLRASVSLPRVGVWHADIEVDTETPDSFGAGMPVQLELGGSLSLKGTVTRGGDDLEGRACARLVGGAGGLGRTARAQAYVGVPLQVPLGDILTTAREVLSPSVLSTVTGHLLLKWTAMAENVGRQLLALVAALPGEPAWRFLPDGSLWIGEELWPAHELADATLAKRDPGRDCDTYVVEEPALLPGVLFGGRKVSNVIHAVAGDSIRTEVWYES